MCRPKRSSFIERTLNTKELNVEERSHKEQKETEADNLFPVFYGQGQRHVYRTSRFAKNILAQVIAYDDKDAKLIRSTVRGSALKINNLGCKCGVRTNLSSDFSKQLNALISTN